MEERPANLARTQSLRARLPFVSQSALSAILEIAASEPLPEQASRRTLRRARDSITYIQTPYGKLHQHISVQSNQGCSVDLEVQHPLAFLYHACTSSAGLSALVGKLAAASAPTPARPWNIIMYCDEILPGSQLAYKSGRKLWCCYWTVLEFGSSAIAHEDLYTILCARRPFNHMLQKHTASMHCHLAAGILQHMTARLLENIGFITYMMKHITAMCITLLNNIVYLYAGVLV